MTRLDEHTTVRIRVRWEALLTALAVGIAGVALGMALQAQLDRAIPSCPPQFICTPI